jgi:hypothetical protein
MPKRRLLAFTLAFAALGPASRADSGLRLPYPDFFGEIPAATYDDTRVRVGSANLKVERLEGGNVRILSESGIEDGARTLAVAELAPVDSGRALQLVVQESRSVDPAGVPLGVMRIDHHNAVATCTSGVGERSQTSEIALPDGDRVANVPLNLLFLPLVQGDSEQLSFQIFLCRGGPRFMDFEARLAPPNGTGGGLVEVRYGPDLGLVSMIARGLIPQLSIWFDPRSPQSWAAHRVPLYSKGPEVFVIRDGVPSRWLGH